MKHVKLKKDKVCLPVFIHAGAEVLVPVVHSSHPLLDGRSVSVSFLHQSIGQLNQELYSLSRFFRSRFEFVMFGQQRFRLFL